jgi:hypothetical protein
MPYNHNKINVLDSGWYVVYKNGEVITQAEDISWIQIPNKKDIKIMGLKRHNKHLELEDKETYIAPGETHLRELCINPGTGFAVTKNTLQGWFIGYYDKNCKVIHRINAETGEYTVDEVPYT